MTDWSSGYVSEVEYSFGYYAELNPLRARLALLYSGWALPGAATACELGFGQGISVNVHAAASSTQWWGTDFNPSHASFAQDLAAGCGSSARLYDEAFADFCARPDLPDFDHIGLHGVWSWISDANRAVIVDFIRRKLKPGGLVYISYNTLPGHSPTVSLRHLFVQRAEVMEAPGLGLIPRIEAGLDFAQRVLALEPAFAAANPQVVGRLDRIKADSRQNLAHEYFNRDWRPMHFGETAELLSAAKLSFAGSAHYLDHIDVLNLTDAQRTFLYEIPDAAFRETVRDFMINQQFRRDYWIKGPRPISGLDRFETLQRERFLLMARPEDIQLTAAGAATETRLRPEFYEPIIAALSDHQPKTFDEVQRACNLSDGGFSQLFEAMMVLIGKGAVAPAQAEAQAAEAKPRTDKLNARILAHARSHESVGVLASPVTAGGAPANRLQQLFLLARAQGWASPSDWGAFAWSCLSEQGQLVVAEGKVLQTPAENLAELTTQAEGFAEHRLPILKAAMVA